MSQTSEPTPENRLNDINEVIRGLERLLRETQQEVRDLHLDRIVDATEMAMILKMRKRELLEHCKGRNPKIPAIRFNEKVLRFHVRSVLAKMAVDSGLSVELVGAMFSGINRPVQ